MHSIGVILINETWQNASVVSRADTLTHELGHYLVRRFCPSIADRLGKMLDDLDSFVEPLLVDKTARAILWHFKMNSLRHKWNSYWQRQISVH